MSKNKMPHPQPCGCADCEKAKVEGARLRDEALDVLEETNEDWVDHAISAIFGIAKAQALFTADDVWREVGYDPANKKALGSAMRKASNLGYCERTNQTRQCMRPSRHRGNVQVWMSKLYRG